MQTGIASFENESTIGFSYRETETSNQMDFNDNRLPNTCWNYGGVGRRVKTDFVKNDLL